MELQLVRITSVETIFSTRASIAIYVSHLPSSDESFSGEDGLNDFEQLLLNGAIKELGIHVETTGAGGASDKAQNSFYKADDLEFVDSLPIRTCRTSGAAGMGDPMQMGTAYLLH